MISRSTFVSALWASGALLATSALAFGQVSKDELFRHPFAVTWITGLGVRASLGVSKVNGELHAHLMTFPKRDLRLLAQADLGKWTGGRLGFCTATSGMEVVLAIIENEGTSKIQTRLICLQAVKTKEIYSIKHSSVLLAGRRLTPGICNRNEQQVYAIDSPGNEVLSWPADRLPLGTKLVPLPWDAASRSLFLQRRKWGGFVLQCAPSLARGFSLTSRFGRTNFAFTTHGLMAVSNNKGPALLPALMLSPKGAAVDPLGLPLAAEAGLRIKANLRATLVAPDHSEIVMHEGNGSASVEVDLGGRLDREWMGRRGYKLAIGEEKPRPVILELRYGTRFSEIQGVTHALVSGNPMRAVTGRKGRISVSASVAAGMGQDLSGYLLLSWRDVKDKDHLVQSRSGRIFLSPRVVLPLAIHKALGAHELRQAFEATAPYQTGAVSSVLLAQLVIVNRKTNQISASRVRAYNIRTWGPDSRFPKRTKIIKGRPWALRSNESKRKALDTLEKLWSLPSMLGQSSVAELEKILVSR